MKKELLTHIFPECEKSFLIFVDGEFSKELSHVEGIENRKGIKLLYDRKEIKKNALFLQNLSLKKSEFPKNSPLYQKAKKEEAPLFPSLEEKNADRERNFYLLLPPGLKDLPPLQILHLYTDTWKKDGQEKKSKASFIIAKEASLHLYYSTLFMRDFFSIENSYSGKEERRQESDKKGSDIRSGFLSCGMEIVLEEKAKCKMVRIDSLSAPASSKMPLTTPSTNSSIRRPDDNVRYDRIDVWQKKNSHFFLHYLEQDEREAFFQCRIFLEKEGAKTDIKGLLSIKGDGKKKIDVALFHEEKETRSNHIAKSFIADRGKLFFEGKAILFPEAKNAFSSIINENVLLSDEARVETKPSMEVFAEDVVAKHGATISEWDEKELFYLQSRGLDEKKAKALLLYAKVKEFVKDMDLSSCKKRIETLLVEDKG